nr:ribonuclease P protein component [Campylobacter blaseri]
MYENAKKWHCECAVVYFLPFNEDKFTVVASKKVGNAVKRNLSKRLIRAAFLSFKDELETGKYIIIAKSKIGELKYDDICKNLKWSFKKMGALR